MLNGTRSSSMPRAFKGADNVRSLRERYLRADARLIRRAIVDNNRATLYLPSRSMIA
jgi:hypothetical protein